MMAVFIILLVVGVGVSATSPREPKEGIPIPVTTKSIVPVKCGPNSHFVRRSKICPPQDCSALIDPYWLCEDPGFKAECRCNDGFYRRNGTCISRDECLAQCGPLERYVADSSECQRTCANYKVTAPQSLCKPFSGCVCVKGRVRLNDNATGPCVLPKDCPVRKCPLHEHWQDCPSVCANETCMSKSPTYKCLLPAIPLPCKGRCMCDKGYLRNEVGDCVREDHCPIKECPINEVWRCASMCPWDSCKRLEAGFQCPPGIISVCIPACACKDGYLRNEKGICIPRELCPASLRCGINEVAVECEAYPPLTCESVYTLYEVLEDPPCNPGCDCRPGYLRNKRNICVPSECCPTVPSNKCGPNQEYKKCGTICEPSCSDLDNPRQVCPEVCVEGCFCKEGFLKDEHGNCVYPSECPLPICTKPNEVAKDCGSYCEIRTCEDYNRTDIGCPAVCVRGCFCRKGYVRNAYGVCIHPKKCPSKPVCLQEHEEYQSCGSSCPDNCDNYKNPDRICTAQCVAGCNCKKGYVRNLKDGTCIKPEQCPIKKCTGVNEELNYCASYCPVTCANRYTQGDWACITLCRVACDCIPGTLMNDTGSCVPVDQCTPPICRDNEKYMECGTACPITCDNYKNPPKFCTDQCIEDCFCKEGYVRNRFGRCVKPEDCEPICPAGEKWNECSAHCQDTCENYNSSNRLCTYQCQSGCVCETGTVRRKDGQCVLPTECTEKIICPIDEVYDPCSAHCEPTCENHGPDRACTAICKPGCKCREGLVRRKDGKCVKLKECPEKPICPIDEVYDPCSAHCEPTCENHGPNRPCTKICTPGCKCREGLVRRKDGKCVKVKECPEKPICPKDEVYDPCSAHCEPTCENHGPDRPCTKICKPGCKCREGLVRRKDGKCVKVKECQPTCPSSEHYDECNAHCEETCELHGSNITCLPYCNAGCKCNKGLVRRKDGRCVNLEDCPLLCPKNEVYDPCLPSKCPPGKMCAQVCRPGCKCKDGFIRNNDGKCVTEKIICPKDEVYDQCSAHCEPTCENHGPNRPCTMICTPGCKCREGLVRRKDGKCVKVKECPEKIICPKDEVYDPCSAHCEPTCENHGPDRPCTKICKLGCKCREGLVRRKDGKCVKLNECRDLCPSNEVYDPCITPKCPPGKSCIQACRPGCRCKKGLVRDKRGKCVNPKCPVNEQWVDCVLALCIALRCDQLGFPIGCPGIFGPCDGGCVCANNYVRDSNNVCIPKRKCPSCRNDFNATSGCGNHCGRQCTDYKNPPKCNAARLCEYNGCDCKKGYVWDIVTGQCLDPVDCPVPCNGDLYAEKVECPNPCPATCARPTTAICPRACLKEGCQCRPGFVLNPDGKCVRPEKCPDKLGCNGDPNAQISSCVSLCEPTCGKSAVFCPAICRLGCKCKSGYILSKPGGLCIKPEKCVNATTTTTEAPCKTDRTRPRRDTGSTTNDAHATGSTGGQQNTNSSPNPLILCPNDEIWINCKAGYCKPQYCRDIGRHIACPKVTDSCPGGCICRKGLLRRDSDGVCIPENECPINQPCSDPNAIRKKCASHQSCRPTCSVPNPNICPRVCIINGCECKKGYVLSGPRGICTKIKDCPKGNDVSCNGDPNAVIKAFPPPCPPTCKTPNGIPGCLMIGQDVGCVCKRGYIKDDNDKCILPDDCKANQPKPCDDPNAERVECAPAPSCRSTCATPNPSPCILSCAVDGCVCKKGFVLSKKGGKCIPVDQCPKNVPCNGDSNAVIIANPPPCPSTCDSPNASYLCRRAVPPVACKCKDGLIKATYDGKCIKPEECPGGNPCGPNSTFVPCNVRCKNGYCPVDDKPVTTPCEQPDPCPSGCACKINYKRKSINDDRCILAATCPRVNCTRPHEIWNPCPECLAESCADVNNQPTTCNTLLLNCQPQCVCKKGYLRNSTISDGFTKDKCIPAKDCPQNKPCEDPNAERVQCAPDPSCRSTCATPNPSPCKEICVINQCVCKKGYVLSKKGGKCIPVDKCPKDKPCNGDWNAVIKVNPIPCPSTCSVPNASPGCKRYAPPVGCECKPGYLLNDKDKCIKPDQCPDGNPCGKNATFVPCVVNCPTNNCPVGESKGIIACRPPHPCPSGCSCKKGYKRKSSSDYTCILESDCPNNKCSDPNAERVKCAPPAECRATCANPNPKPCISQICIKNECVCKKGYVLSKKGGKCIPVDQCPKDKPCNGDWNAVIKANPIPCPSTCSVPNADPWCKRYAPPVGCECKPGYLLNDKDKCIKPDQCPDGNPCGKNATFVPCVVNCPTNNCPVGESKGIIACSPPHPCPSGCSCKKGYKRKSSSDYTCILESDCPPPIKCKKYEVYNPCSYTCPPQTCDSIRTSYNCEGAPKCVPGCDCIPEYLRNGTEKDPCIPSELCPQPEPVCGTNEHYEINTIKCDLTCKNYHLEPVMGPCKPTSACFCDDGYVRNSNGLCIPKKKCPQNLVCPPNEVVSECYNSCLMTCKTRFRSDGRMCHLACIETGCVCKEGYLRHDNGTCVPISQCSPPRCNDDETYSKCGTACPPTCQNRGDNCTACTEQCVEGCFCKKGLVRADDGCCINPKCCPKRTCTGDNEYFDPCPPTCPRGEKCENLWSKIPCTPIDCCDPQCRCKTGYFRNDQNKCVTAKECENPTQCGPNEVSTDCYNDCQKTCKNRFKSDGKVCALVCKGSGCVCKADYLRHDNGTCVPKYECSPAECDKGKVYSECGSSCPPSCENRGNTCLVCTAQCVPGCFCAKGTIRAPNNTCVKPDSCPRPHCGPNEEFVKCPPTCPRTDECKNLWSKVPCTPIDCCHPQCRCKSGFYRKNGVCVRAKEC